MSVNGNLTIVLQAGGESKRMGRSKATVPFLGEPLIWRGIHRLLPLADEFIITTNEPQNLNFLDHLVEQGALRLVRDIDDVRGALHGVKTAFSAATKEFVALVACDMVFPSRNLIAAELSYIEEQGADAVIPYTANGHEPFHGVYRRKPCLDAALRALERGEKRATSWAVDVKRLDFTSEMIAKAEPRGGCFINVNTPQELARVEQSIIDDCISEREKF